MKNSLASPALGKNKVLAFLKSLLFFPPVLAGIWIFLALKENQLPPEKRVPLEKRIPVRVLEVHPSTLKPRVLAYGVVKPHKVWEALAEVSGKILKKNPLLKKGAFLKKGELLFEIDPTDYHLEQARLQAELHKTQAQLQEWEIRKSNTEASLKIEQKRLEMAQKELERQKELGRHQTVSTSQVDQQEQATLAQMQSFQTLQNVLNLLPAEYALLQAQQEVVRVQLQIAAENIKRTTLILPFDGIISDVFIENHQFAQAGRVLAVADSIDIAEITAQVPLEKMRTLVEPHPEFTFENNNNFEKFSALLGIVAKVRFRSGSLVLEWNARVVRFNDAIEAKTRSLGVVVAVDEPYSQARPGIRPPLFKNLFVEVELQGKARPIQALIPRSAIHEKEQIYVVNLQSRLEKRSVSPLFAQSNFFALDQEIMKPGEFVIVSDLLPALPGLLLEPIRDQALEDALKASAEGNIK
jgi:multidrug efflux pump subunit AcrA (membrane-fusion protein)